MPTYIPGISASGALAPGLSAATVRAVLELLSSAEIAAAYLPLAGGVLTGGIQVPSIDAETIDATSIDATTSLTLNSEPVATHSYVDDEIVAALSIASNASNLTSGTVSDARLSANVARRDQANTFAANQNITGSLTTTDIIVSNSTSGGLHIVNSGMRLVRNVASLLLENQSTGWPLDLSHGNGGTTNVVGAQGGLPTLGFSLTRNNNNPDVRIVRNATGPTAETRSAGGLRVCNADGSALAGVASSEYNFGTGNGRIVTNSNAGVRILNSSGTNGFAVANSFVCDSTGYFYVNGRGILSSSANGNLHVQNFDLNDSVDQTLVLGPGTSASNGVRIKRAVGTTTVQVRNGNDSADASLNLANLTASGQVQGTFRPTQFTVATLPSAAANTGRTVQVTDSSVDFPGNIGNTVAGGGAFNVDVKSNGTNWRITG